MQLSDVFIDGANPWLVITVAGCEAVIVALVAPRPPIRGAASRNALQRDCRHCHGIRARIDFLQREHNEALPRLRAELDDVKERVAASPVTSLPGRAGMGDSSAIKQPTRPQVQAQGDARADADAHDITSGNGAGIQFRKENP